MTRSALAERAPDGPGFVYTCLPGQVREQPPHVWVADPGDPDAASFAIKGILDDLYDPLIAVFALRERSSSTASSNIDCGHQRR